MIRRLLSAAALGLTLSFSATAAFAAAPQQKTQAPGYYRFMVGSIEVTALNDGTVKLPVKKLLTNTTPEAVDAALRRHYLPDMVETSVNAFLINTGTKLVLVDTGAGGLFGPTLGSLLVNLRAAGYTPEQVDEVCITHMHPDHVGGLMSGDKLAFPNARLNIDRADADYWLSEAAMKSAPEDKQGFFKGDMVSVGPWAAAGKLRAFSGTLEVTPGVRSEATHGHTPGHNTWVVESEGQKLVLWGDLMHVAAVQFADPSVTIAFDSESKDAARERREAYERAAREGYLVGVAHISFPGVGRLRKAGNGFEWVPINYSAMK